MEFRTLREKLEFSHEKYKIMGEMEKLFVEEGYLYLEPGPFEDYQSYIRRGGEDDGQYLKAILPGGEVKLLCADLTAGLVEDIYMEGLSSSLKVFYNGDVYRNRNGKPEILTKVGVEVFGEETIATDVEILSMATTILEKYHDRAMIELGAGTVVELYMDRGNFTEEQRRRITDYMKQRDAGRLKDYLKDLGKWEEGEIFYLLLDCHGSWERISEKFHIFGGDPEILPILRHLEELNGFLTERTDCIIRYDFALVPDFNYYSSFYFRGFYPDCNEELLKGGRYQLINREGQVVPGVGFSIELTTLMNYLGGRL